MSFQVQAISSVVSITGEVTAAMGIVGPSSAQTAVHVELNGNAGVQNIYTVPAGKTFYLMGVFFGNYTAGGVQASILNNSSGVVMAAALVANSSTSFTPVMPIYVFTAGQNVKFSGQVDTRCTIVGYYVAA